MDAEVLELSPPLTISEEDLDRGIAAVLEAVS
jgi:4-aminobutyrate aminotransferase-like enzyme